MTAEQVTEFVEAVDEMRRLHRVLPWPMNVHQLRATEAAEQKVDALLDRWRAPEAAAIAGTPTASSPSPATT